MADEVIYNTLKARQEANSPWDTILPKVQAARAQGENTIKLDPQEISKLGIPTKDAINHPPHYTTGKIEVIDFLEDQKLNYNLGNVVKYICRADHKGSRREDLRKALWYLERELKKDA